MTEEKKPRAAWRGWTIALFCGLVALAALVSGSAYGTVTASRKCSPTSSARCQTLDPRLIAWISAAVLLVFGLVAVTRISRLLAHHVSATSVPTAGSAVRIISGAVGYLIVVFGMLAELKVSIEHLLVGAGLAGVVLGIAAQPSLGNVFAGLVLIFARPFRVGDRVRIRSGALGGIFDARVLEMTLTYVTLRAEEGEWKIPNTAMLAAGVLRTPRTPLPPPATPAAPAAPPTQATATAPAPEPAPAVPSMPAAAGGSGAGGPQSSDGAEAPGAASDGTPRATPAAGAQGAGGEAADG